MRLVDRDRGSLPCPATTRRRGVTCRRLSDLAQRIRLETGRVVVHHGRVVSRLVVLGSCGGWPEAGRACSGYVLEHEGVRIVLDLGYGTLPRLLQLLGSSAADGIDAVVVTHAHPDHLVDVHGLFRARWFARRGEARIPLYVADGVLDMVAGLEDGDAAAVAAVFDSHPLPAGPYRVGPFLLESEALPHYVPNVGVRLSAPGLTVAYTGDTGPDAALADLGRDADLYIIDATDRDQQRGGVPSQAEPRRNLSAREAAAAGAAADARRLLLTHFWPGNDRDASYSAAAKLFSGDLILADEGLEITLP